MSQMFRVMIRASKDEASSIKETLQSVGVLGVCPKTHYEGGLVRAVYTFPDETDFGEFEDAAEDAVQAAFPGAVVDRQVMIAHLKR